VNHFEYRDGVLHAEDVAVPEIAAAVGTPFYCYSTATLTRHYRVFAEAFSGLDALICYAMKANSNQAVIRTLAKLGAGADVVSEGELRRALAAGVPANKILFSGVGKTAREMDFALAAGIRCFNVESLPELELLSARAVATGHVAPVSLRINPDVDARTHRKISTGKAENKFGIAWKDARAAYARASPSTTPSRCWSSWSGRCAPTAMRSPMSMSAAGSASPIAPTMRRRRCPTPMPPWSRAISRRSGSS
jgi:diaminopimelate decarboxylase